MPEPVMMPFKNERTLEEGWMFFCPGCREYHSYTTVRPRDGSGPLWTWDGNREQPTFRASLLYPNQKRCHLHVTKGQIQYLKDCTHALAGQTVPMVPFDSMYTKDP